MIVAIFPLLLMILIVSVAVGAVLRHEGDLFAWSRHPATRITFAVLGLALVCLTVIPEVLRATRLPSTPDPIVLNVPAQSLSERFVAPPSQDPHRGRREVAWTNGTLLVYVVYLDGYGRAMAVDGGPTEWDGTEALLLKGEREIGDATVTYRITIRDIQLRWDDGICSVRIDGSHDSSLMRGNGRSGSSGGLSNRDSSVIPMISLGGRLRSTSLQLRVAGQSDGVRAAVLYVEPLPAEARLVEQDLTALVAAHASDFVHDLSGGGLLDNMDWFRVRRAGEAPPFFGMISAIGPGPLLLFAGVLLIAIAVPVHRGISTLGGLFVASVLMIGVDTCATGYALRRVEAFGDDPVAQSQLIQRASATYFCRGDVAEWSREQLSGARLLPRARVDAWNARVLDDWYRQNPKLRDLFGLGDETSLFDADHDLGWCPGWWLKAVNKPADYLVISRGGQNAQSGSHVPWLRSSLRLAGVESGVVVWHADEKSVGPEMFVRVSGMESVAPFIHAPNREQELLRSDFWREKIVPLLSK